MVDPTAPRVEDVVRLPEDASLDQVAETMHAEGVGSVVVTGETTDLAGIVTDRDVALALRDGIDPTQTTASDVMTADPVTAEQGAEVFEVVEMMREEGVRRLPLVDEAGDVVRLVSLDDVLALLGEEFADVAALVEAQT
ncbi:cyclic nucleotide-binding/CBS domain-containing protein [Halobacterium sp. CBA1126]|uniref:CBS domain-containing protein n=1 Tax=Halobacterium sp. CBA1126 TaxID=2668074 RepID=UPI0012F75B3A|nr:CBS domain-containing protein [Halobacterium sp. CBA1126]MUV59732.1 CBS domain-containing protein [Halobacterium sp. CBA1126]